jgi:XTP/dITP diphosphohydrolase
MSMAGSRASTLILGTRNPHKVREMARLFAPAGFTVLPLPAGIELPPEVGETFSANALPKAQTAAAATGQAAIADDSGIEAAALQGGPGVRSARYAGPQATDRENLDKFIAEVPHGDALRYVCALAYVDLKTGQERIFCGYCAGHMAPGPRGSGGFGYDPVFIPQSTGDTRTMAELSDQEKDALSHRGDAVRRFLSWRGP